MNTYQIWFKQTLIIIKINVYNVFTVIMFTMPILIKINVNNMFILMSTNYFLQCHYWFK